MRNRIVSIKDNTEFNNIKSRDNSFADKGANKPIKLTKGWGDKGLSMKANYSKLY